MTQRVTLVFQKSESRQENTESADASSKAYPSKSVGRDKADAQKEFPKQQCLEKLPPGEEGQLTFPITKALKDRPWLGMPERIRFDVVAELAQAGSFQTTSAIQPAPKKQSVELEVQPVVPVWLQVLAGLVGLAAVTTTWWLNPRSYHVAPINAVRLIGNETTVVSGSSDQTLRRWDVVETPFYPGGVRPVHRQLLAQTGKAIRVIRESPLREGQIAVGLESGDIELWEVSPPRRIQTLFEGSDRVFDLDFSTDGRYLFSGHGSGLVRLWDLQDDQPDSHRQLMTGVAVSAVVTLNGEAESNMQSGAQSETQSETQPETQSGEPSRGQSWVAIAGQYDTLLIWDWQKNRAYRLNYPPSGTLSTRVSQSSLHGLAESHKDNYITSLATTADSRLLAVLDNRGHVSLWDVAKIADCIKNQTTPLSPSPKDKEGNEFLSVTCEPDTRLDYPSISLPDETIRAIALSPDGCYLTTAGDNGHLVLWSLGPSRSKIPVARYRHTPMRSVDIERSSKDELLIAAGGPRNRVTLHRHRLGQNSDLGCATTNVASDGTVSPP